MVCTAGPHSFSSDAQPLNTWHALWHVSEVVVAPAGTPFGPAYLTDVHDGISAFTLFEGTAASAS